MSPPVADHELPPGGSRAGVPWLGPGARGENAHRPRALGTRPRADGSGLGRTRTRQGREWPEARAGQPSVPRRPGSAVAQASRLSGGTPAGRGSAGGEPAGCPPPGGTARDWPQHPAPEGALSWPLQHPKPARALPGARSRDDRVPVNFPVEGTSFRCVPAAARPFPAPAHSSHPPVPQPHRWLRDVPVCNILVTQAGCWH